MADVLSTGTLTSIANTASSAAYTAIYAVLGLILFGLLLWFIIDLLSYNRHVFLKVLTKNSFFIVQAKAKEVNNKGLILWKTRRYGIASVPPPDAIHATQRGKFVAQGYYSPETGIVWATDRVTREEFEKKITEWRITPDGKKEQVFREIFQPLTTQQRALYVAEIEKANLRGNKKLLELVFQYAPLFLVFMIFALIVIFYEDITKPSVEMARATADISRQNAQISEENARILSILVGGDANITQTIRTTTPPDVTAGGG